MLITVLLDVDAAIEQWVRAHKIGSGGDPFRVLVCALPKLLTSRQFVDLVPICSAFAHDPFPRAKAYRDVARFIRRDRKWQARYAASMLTVPPLQTQTRSLRVCRLGIGNW